MPAPLDVWDTQRPLTASPKFKKDEENIELSSQCVGGGSSSGAGVVKGRGGENVFLEVCFY